MVQKHSIDDQWDGLSAILAVSQSRSIRAAAEKLGIAHTTLARRVEAAEAALGVVVFVRSTSGHALTEAGERMLPHIMRMSEEADALRRGLAGGDTTPSGTVKITLPPALLEYCLAPILPRFSARYPKINLDFDARYSFSNLDRHEADIAVRYQTGPEPHLVGTRVGTSIEYAYGTASVIEDMRTGSKPRLIGWARDERFQQRAERLGFGEHTVGFVCIDLHGQVALAANGLGIAILPNTVGDKCAGLQRINAETSVEADDVWVLMHADLRRSARVRAVSDFLSHELRLALTV